MIAQLFSSAIHGVEAFRITVEVSLSGKGIGILLTGLPDGAIKESLGKIDTAIQSCGYQMPRTKLVINLIPADVRKMGTAYDLPIALGILLVSGQVHDLGKLKDYTIVGEMGLDGSIHPVRGALCMTIRALKENFKGILLLLNYPPNKEGLISPIDAQRTDSLRYLINGTFKTNLAIGAKIKTLHSRGANYKPSNMLDNNESSYYATSDAFATDTITFDLGSQKMFDVVMLQEVIELGHRTTGWSIDYSTNGKTWTPIPEATGKQSIGYKWLVKFKPVTASKVRLRITSGKACAAIHTFGIYKQP